ncbi:hypothetical protein CRUP_033465, partial [Coryphaenoides rupestris]
MTVTFRPCRASLCWHSAMARWAAFGVLNPPGPLKVGTPLSALTPAPVTTTTCRALEKISLKAAIRPELGVLMSRAPQGALVCSS